MGFRVPTIQNRSGSIKFGTLYYDLARKPSNDPNRPLRNYGLVVSPPRCSPKSRCSRRHQPRARPYCRQYRPPASGTGLGAHLRKTSTPTKLLDTLAAANAFGSSWWWRPATCSNWPGGLIVAATVACVRCYSRVFVAAAWLMSILAALARRRSDAGIQRAHARPHVVCSGRRA